MVMWGFSIDGAGVNCGSPGESNQGRATARGRDVVDVGTHVSSASPSSRLMNYLDYRSHDLHVLLRHRPRSIPQAQESA